MVRKPSDRSGMAVATIWKVSLKGNLKSLLQYMRWVNTKNNALITAIRKQNYWDYSYISVLLNVHLHEKFCLRYSKTLSFLIYRNNSLTKLPMDLFIGMPAIRQIDVSSNGITTLDQRTWSPIWHQLMTLDLEGDKAISSIIF